MCTRACESPYYKGTTGCFINFQYFYHCETQYDKTKKHNERGGRTPQDNSGASKALGLDRNYILNSKKIHTQDGSN